ncbi:MAG UNVERIFIED_CONTAM: hypothetical protein LVR18_36290 [Planctomycetaceae bacterium]
MRNLSIPFLLGGLAVSAGFATLFHMGGLSGFQNLLGTGVVAAIAAVVLGLAVRFAAASRLAARLRSISFFTMFNAFFWLAFEQAGSSMTLFTDRYTDARIGSWDMPDDVVPVGESCAHLRLRHLRRTVDLAGQASACAQPARQDRLGPHPSGHRLRRAGDGRRTIQVGPGGPEDVVRKAAVWFIPWPPTSSTRWANCAFSTRPELRDQGCRGPVPVSLLMGIWFILESFHRQPRRRAHRRPDREARAGRDEAAVEPRRGHQQADRPTSSPSS